MNKIIKKRNSAPFKQGFIYKDASVLTG